MSQYDLKFDIKINVDSDLHFTGWILSRYDLKFDLKINIGHSDLHFTVQ